MNHPPLIHRRELLRRAAVLLGGTLSTPAVLGILNGCSARRAPGWTPAFFTDAQMAVVAEVAEIMIPRSDSPGARDVGVPAFIDAMLANVYPAEDQEHYLSGLADLDLAARRQEGNTFLALDGKARLRLVQGVHDAALQDIETAADPFEPERRPFVLMTKELTLLGFFTSHVGATQVLQYDSLPGTFSGCLPLLKAGNGRTWATETSLPF